MTSSHFAELAELCRAVPPDVVLVLGSGMGPVAERLRSKISVPFAEVPGLPAAGVAGHRGQLSLGAWAGRRVLIFEGRLHFYEGHAWEQVVKPIQIAAHLGAPNAVLTNAAGGIADHLVPGSLMMLREHMDLTRPWWWRYPGPGGLAAIRPSPYSPRLREILVRGAASAGLVLPEGTYAALTGPSYETPAEIRALRGWGADAVGMSTAREVEAGVAAGLECAAISCITNRAAGLSAGPLQHQEVLDVAAALSAQVAELLEHFLHLLPATLTAPAPNQYPEPKR